MGHLLELLMGGCSQAQPLEVIRSANDSKLFIRGLCRKRQLVLPGREICPPFLFLKFPGFFFSYNKNLFLGNNKCKCPSSMVNIRKSVFIQVEIREDLSISIQRWIRWPN